MNESQRTRLSWTLAGLFLLALVMGPGPGMLLINRPRSFLGIPQLYAWGLLWYGVEVIVVVLAYALVWSPRRRREDQGTAAAPDPPETPDGP